MTTSHPLRGHNHTGGGFAAADLPDGAAHATGPPLRPQGVADALAARRPCGPALDPGASAPRWAGDRGQAQGLPRTTPGTPSRSENRKTTTRNVCGFNGTDAYYTQHQGPSGDAGMQKT